MVLFLQCTNNPSLQVINALSCALKLWEDEKKLKTLKIGYLDAVETSVSITKLQDGNGSCSIPISTLGSSNNNSSSETAEKLRCIAE